MAQNFPYPLQLKVFYTFNNIEHVHTVGLRPDPLAMTLPAGEAPSAYELLNHDGSNVDFESFVTDYVEAPAYTDVPGFGGKSGFAWLFGSGTAFSRAELWRYPPQSLDGQFLTAIDLSFTGKSPLAGVSLLQTTYTLRSSEGGTLRITALEGGFTSEFNRAPFSALPDREKRFIDGWFLQLSTPVIARDGGRAIAFLRRSNGQNEALFRKRHRL